ncbi:MAG: hypothetical protein J6P16_05505 [Eubacterium sp.]|nr:hypothetical protein [Eubacterium sp.]
MERENKLTENLGTSIDWQIGNWAQDAAMIAHNARLYDEVYQNIVAGTDFDSNLDLCRELGFEFKENGDKEKAEYIESLTK